MRWILSTITLLALSTASFAINNEFPGGEPNGATPADIETKPEKYYPPQHPLPTPNVESLPNQNPQQNPE